MTVDDPLKVYLDEVCAVPLLTAEEEVVLCERIRSEGPDAEAARKRLVEANLSMVVSVVQGQPQSAIHPLDLVVVGNNALMAAVQAFPESGADTFSAYARTSVEQAVAKAVDEETVV